MGKAIDVERTAFGERLVQARLHAKLTQPEAARLANISQSNLSALERSGQGSAKTVTLAGIYGVRAEWLASGQGPMLDATQVPPAANTVASEQVAHYLVGTPAGTDYRTIALTLAAALRESGISLTVEQFIDLLEATYKKLKPE